MNSRFYLASVFLLLLTASIMFGAIQVTNGQEASPIFGYPYSAHQAEGTESGQAPMFYASTFQLNENATITLMSCKIYIDYDLSLRSFNDTTYRFAIYSDNNGQVGELISQTELGTVSKPPDAQLPLQIDDFLTLNFASPVSLQAGTYWLAAVIHGPNALVYDDMTNQSIQRARCSLNETTFPSTVTSIQYIDNEVVAIFASGQGASSVMPPPPVNASNPGMSTISVNCQSENSTGNMQVFGTLSLYGTGIPQATLEFSYQQIGEPIWRSIGSTNTSADGSYSIDWSPSTQGNYLINATYWGSSTTSFVFKAIPVLITAPSGNQSQTVFSVDSNSTVANLAFDSANAQLSFSVTGLSGTMGYADVCVSKSLVDDPSTIQAFIDGNPVNYTVSSTADSWILHFSYHHSSHNVQCDLNGGGKTVPELPMQAWVITLAALFVSTTAALIIFKRRAIGTRSARQLVPKNLFSGNSVPRIRV